MRRRLPPIPPKRPASRRARYNGLSSEPPENGRTDLARIAGTTLDRGAELDALPLVSPATRDVLIEQAIAGIQVSAVQARKKQQKPTAQEESSNTAAALRQQSSHGSGLVATDFIDNDLSTLQAAWNNSSKAVREKFLRGSMNISPSRTIARDKRLPKRSDQNRFDRPIRKHT